MNPNCHVVRYSKGSISTFRSRPVGTHDQDPGFFLEDLPNGFGGQAPRSREFGGSVVSFKDSMTVLGFVTFRV